MGKRILLFIITNLLVIITITTVWSFIASVTDLNYLFQTGEPGLGIDLVALGVFSLLVGFIGSFTSLAMSRLIAKWMMKVKVLDPADSLTVQERELIEKVHRFSRAAGLTHMPQVGIYPSAEINAFATGPSKKRSLVAVSQGLLDQLDEEAVEGVIAHEVAHVSNGDMVTMTLLQGIVNTFAVFFSRIVAIVLSRLVREEFRFFVQFIAVIVFQILFSILGSLVVAAYSRHREFHADRGGGDLAGNDKMAHALRSLKAKVNRTNVKDQTDDSAVATMKISGKSNVMKLFSTHPDLDERIARLEQR
ncbi:protease HtpX [Jeotgalibacillus terrae]|uniref:Protease HtpX homolog n=1 Tax=Jeotgalibacillus terrae TaxID=587735 RepID=A0ABW5ZLF7_9BACL|nr:protease HtpX [Jeotgalibacillus terrae]MBM7578025.1 heat shock protein HtpX [Jeotgalibacillus terrae]